MMDVTRSHGAITTTARFSQDTSVTLPGTPDQVSAARAFLLRAIEDPALHDVAELLVSEIMTNAIVHTESGRGGQVRVSVRPADTGIRVEVEDEGPRESGRPAVPRRQEELAEAGRGLLIVRLLAARWGFRAGGNGTTTWFELDTGRPTG
ncbi:ATP-binding protein [Bailinhaonella thermotolerans]|uniref:ATP-binding protein n=1 Tax=Bailinhaonella thermotolerans TaxID=1070861 RepID=A0A3A4ADI4_9ACTN|nr:ATP-binding protein [Bailinhaonella thermotolerans]RJL24110.1 ATP-binding protein [Bailinhaonella thermotolerans]